MYISNEIAGSKNRTEKQEDALIKKAELCVMCTLHMELRIGEYLMTELIKNLQSYGPTRRNEKMQQCSSFFQQTFAGMTYDETMDPEILVHSFNVHVDSDSNQVETIKMSAQRQKKSNGCYRYTY
jgi:hypothetical protein